METFLISYGIPAALALGGIAIITSIILAVKVRALPTGTDLMREIAAAVADFQAGRFGRLPREAAT